MEHEHSKQAIARRLSQVRRRSSYLRDWVYGGIDGAVTTFAIVAGVIGAELSSRVVLILGVANLVADGFSMAAGNYSGTKTEHEEQARLRAIEERHHRRRCRTASARRSARSSAARASGGGTWSGRSMSSPRTAIAGSTPCSPKNTACPRRYARRSRRAASTFASFVLCGAVPLLPFLVDSAGELPAFDRHDRARVLPDRLDQEPLVADRAGGARAARPWRSGSAPRRSHS